MTIGPLIVSNSSYTVGSEVIKTQKHTNQITIANEFKKVDRLRGISELSDGLGFDNNFVPFMRNGTFIVNMQKST